MSNKYFSKPKLIKFYLKKKFVWPARIIMIFLGLQQMASIYAMYDAGYATAMRSTYFYADDPFGFYLAMWFRGAILFSILLFTCGIREQGERHIKNKDDHNMS